MKEFFQKFKNLKFLPLSTILFSVLVSYYWIKIFHFSHPFPKEEFFGTLFLQFAFGFLPNFISRKTGRILTITGAMIFVRLSSSAGVGFDIPTLNGLFFGAICGISFREIILEFLGRRDSQVSPKESDFFRKLLVVNPPPSNKKNILLDIQFAIIVFLIVLTLERFITYFNAPFLKGFGVLETMYLPDISSKSAFALSMKTIDSLIFPLLYFFCEERTSPQTSSPYSHWGLGLSIGLLINLVVLFSQNFYSMKIFSANTNESLSVNRTMGLFRDSGSSSWIIPTLLSFFIWRITQKKGEWRTSTKLIILFSLLVVSILAGLKQGRAYWAILFITIFIILMIFIYRKIQNKILKIAFSPIVIAVFCVSIFLFVKIGTKFQSKTSVDRISENLGTLFEKNAKIESSLTKIDPNRFPLSVIAIHLFSKNIFFGNGTGSFILALYDKSIVPKKTFAMIDSAPSLYLGLLSEVGLFGTIIICLWLINSSIGRKSKSHLYLLILPFLIGYQIVHPDGAFFALFFILAVSPNVKSYRNFEIISVILIFCLSAFFIVHSLFVVNLEGKVPDFRKEKIFANQLSAYEKSKSAGGKRYHVFKSKTAWALQNQENLLISVFLDSSTSKLTIKQRWAILDEKWAVLKTKEIQVSKPAPINFKIESSKKAKYIQVEELSEKGENLFKNQIPFCIQESQFNQKNQFRSL